MYGLCYCVFCVFVVLVVVIVGVVFGVLVLVCVVFCVVFVFVLVIDDGSCRLCRFCCCGWLLLLVDGCDVLMMCIVIDMFMLFCVYVRLKVLFGWCLCCVELISFLRL